jgi:hypothetical protein
MSKPIEEGCRAVIVNSVAGNNGVIVTVGKFVGEVLGWEGCKRWEIDKNLPAAHGSIATTMQEHQLERIDDEGEQLSSWESVEKTIGFVPNREIA